MNHYSEEELLLYSKACVDEVQEAEIEEHLLNCDECNERYIQIIEGFHMTDESNQVSLEFTDNVMKLINRDVKQHKAVKRKRVAPEVLIYYVAAACITLMFSLNGVFDSLFGGFSDMTTSIAQTPVSIEKAVSTGWTERLANDTSKVISELKPGR
ncbi:anti-sigma factor [Acetivibrio cellulolyticus]|uniref:hypothetical protein n=1 Tax=Acetivibrio cellulolyticus TaxID=35830 RepID=UPI0001E2E6A0|nr:hypothetical protein [Acetivibrio cellulolyticus]